MNTIQVHTGGEWVDLMPIIGNRGDRALRDVMQKTGLKARIHRPDPEEGGDDVA